MVSALVLLSVWTCVYAILSAVFTISDDNYPKFYRNLGGHLTAVVVYALTLIAAAISLWEAWKATMVGAGAVFAG